MPAAALPGPGYSPSHASDPLSATARRPVRTRRPVRARHRRNSDRIRGEPGRTHDRCRAIRIQTYRPLRRSGATVRGLCRTLARPGTLLRVRPHARGPADAGARRVRRSARSTPIRRATRSGRWSCSRAASTPARSTARTRASSRCASCSRARAAPARSSKQVVLFVPVFNVDGHERFGAWNRPNQRGPEEMGWRTTAQNLNLNRDYVKADAPEMQAMLRAARRVGSDPLRRPARHRRREVRARHRRSRSSPATAATSRCAQAGPRCATGAGRPAARNGFAAAAVLSLVRRVTTIRHPASPTEVSPPRFSTATSGRATASACWSRRTRGRTIRVGSRPRARPSMPWSNSLRATA